MKFIGKGYYYNVYDLGNGRVRKIPRTQLAQILQLFQWYIFNPKILLEELIRAPYSSAQRNEEYGISKKVVSLAPSFFGNPVFDGEKYEQDKAVIFGDLLENVPENIFLDYCKKYAEIIHLLWARGIGEKIFNFTINAGIDDSGKLIVLDTNEFTFDTEHMKKEISTKRFLRSSSFRRLPKHLKPPIKAIFEREFSLEKFNKIWKSV
jgi:hypothetical protein